MSTGGFAFIPRSLVTKTKTPSVTVSNETSPCIKTGPSVDEDKDVVKATSNEQRWPDAEEPVCIICGKYGEYICDQTDEDVCSLKCKADHLASSSRRQATSSSSVTTNNVVTSGTSEVTSNVEIDNFENHFQKTLSDVRENLLSNKSSVDQQQCCDFFREKLKINTKGVNIPSLVFGFSECGFQQQLIDNLNENNYLTPTPVQMQTIPVGLNYRDMLVSAPTSSGKTASFVLPTLHIISQFLTNLPATHAFTRLPLALVMAPTRELCMQIEEQTKCLCASLQNIKTCLLVGGNPLPQQLYRLRHKIQIIIGTPGRINDILDNHGDQLQLRHIKMVVLDEVDVMLQMGFLKQIDRVLEDVPANSQYMMFSATIPASIQDLAEKRMQNPIFVSIGQSGVTSSLVHQLIMWVEETSKRKKLFSIIREPKHFRPPVLVFVESKMGADILSDSIKEKMNISCESIHSDKTQTERTTILQNFLTGSFQVLVSTNVMARGLDLPNVKQVIIFDMARTIEEYVHQVGRAGRLKTKGFVIAFINKSNKNIFLPLQELCRKSGTKLPEELLNSRYFHDALQNEKKREKDRSKMLKRRKTEQEELNQQSLLQILTKQKR